MTQGRDPLKELATLVLEHGDAVPLDRGMVAIARMERPALDADAVYAELDRLAAEVRHRNVDADGGLEALRTVLFQEAGFRGNRENYHQADNSLIDRVIERRLGIPITLAVIWLEVARRLEFVAEGVGFPGHFLVRHQVAGVWQYVDVFAGGRVLGPGDAQELLVSTQGPRAELEASMLDAVTSRRLLVRVVRNLKNVYGRMEDHHAVVTAIDRILALAPDTHTERRDRGLVYARIGLVRAALEDFKVYLAYPKVPALERKTLERLMLELEARNNYLN